MCVFLCLHTHMCAFRAEYGMLVKPVGPALDELWNAPCSYWLCCLSFKEMLFSGTDRVIEVPG